MIFQDSFNKLKYYCELNNYKGWDPYDGLNSQFFQSIPIINQSPFFRLAWIQLFKRNPINLRPLFRVEKDYNPKALGLFLSANCNLYHIANDKSIIKKINFFTEKILKYESKGWSGACWGYNFDWQSRTFFQPKYFPTVVATSFIAGSLLDAYTITNDKSLLFKARSSCDFILNDLNKINFTEESYGLSYSPNDKTSVFNASLLGVRLLARVFSITKEETLLNEAKKIIKYCCDFQKIDGSWTYGTSKVHQWIDNFHTGYNIECIFDYQNFSGDHTYNFHYQNGLKYYLNTFFLENGCPKYYSNKLYPIDIHAVAQLIITICKIGEFQNHKNIVEKTLKWSIENMQDDEGYFYFQLKRVLSSKIPYMRWSQAWIFLAFTHYYFNKRL